MFLKILSSLIDLEQLSKQPAFINIVKRLASIGADKISKISKVQLRTFAQYALRAIVSFKHVLSSMYLIYIFALFFSRIRSLAN